MFHIQSSQIVHISYIGNISLEKLSILRILQILSTRTGTTDSRVNILRKKAEYIKTKPMNKHYVYNQKHTSLR
jgi:hypothetical protein